MQVVVSVDIMRQSDAIEIQKRTPSKELMLRAGKAIAESYSFTGKTAIVCGKGNNAGDGYVLASEINDGTHECVLFLIDESFSSVGKYYFDKCKEQNISVQLVNNETDFEDYDTIVDCLLGTGFKGTLSDELKKLIEKINKSKSFVISVDINSGLNGDNGIGECFVKSDLTISIGSLKSGLFLGMAKDARKKIINKDIGIEIVGEKYYLLEETDFIDYVSERKNFSNKGTYGTVTLIGGCDKYSGAIKLANLSLSALRAGCGIAKVVVPHSVKPYITPHIVESIIFGIKEKRSGGMAFDKKNIDKALNGVKAIALGMGWGNGKDHCKIIKHILNNYAIPVIIDADGLNALSTDLKILSNIKSRVIVTPHVGEMARLSGKTIDEIIQNPISIAREFAKTHGVFCVLKGPTTIITDGDRVYLCDKGCAGMATAGSGDVLSGIIAGVLGEEKNRNNILLSVSYATYINGLAGELAQNENGDICMTSKDTVIKIPMAIIYLRKALKI